MCSSLTGEEVGKGKAFTHKSQHVKRIEGRGEGKKRKVAECECAGAGVGADVPTRVSLRGEWVKRANRTGTKGGAQSEREGHRAKGRGRALKKRGLGGETREEEKESPQVFDL